MKIAFAVAALLAVAAPAFADGPSKDDAVALIDQVQAYYNAHGRDETAAAIMDPANEEFHQFDGALYAFMADMQGVNVAHGAKPSLAGVDTSKLTDPNGVHLVEEMIARAQDGEGWVNYHWPNKVTGKIDAKTTYVRRLDDDLWAGAGVSE